MYLHCDCSLQQPKRGIQAAHKRLSASVAQRRAFSQCCAAQGFQPVHSHGGGAVGLEGNRLERGAALEISGPNQCAAATGGGMSEK